jgi:hypothetical protein
MIRWTHFSRLAGWPDWANFRPLGVHFETLESRPSLWATFYHVYSYALTLITNDLGYILAEFFSNPSGHPDDLTPS